MPTDWVTSNIEVGPKLDRFGTIHNLMQWLIVDVSERRMEEARAHLARRLDHRGNPRCVTAWCDVLCLAEVSVEVMNDPSKFRG